MGILRAINQAYLDKERKSFDKIYIMVDLHGTVIKPNYKPNDIPKEVYNYALEVLKIMSLANDICLIMYTCSHPHEIEKYLNFFKDNNIHFEYINENKEVKTDINGYGCYDKKPYMNVLLDDKAGFIPEEDWLPILELMNKKYG